MGCLLAHYFQPNSDANLTFCLHGVLQFPLKEDRPQELALNWVTCIEKLRRSRVIQLNPIIKFEFDIDSSQMCNMNVQRMFRKI